MAWTWDPNLKEYVDVETDAERRAREAREAAEDARRAQQVIQATPPGVTDSTTPGVTPGTTGTTPGTGDTDSPPVLDGGPTGTGGGTTGNDTGDNPNSYMSVWQSKGYVDENGMVELPWLGPGAKMKLSDAVEKFYPDRPPTANDIPPWVQIKWETAYGVPAQYVNQVPADLRGMFQQMLDATRSAGYQPPAVGTMASNPNYRTA